ncbi:oxidoreductase [Hyunsoonleella flava]|uniref:Oxidoreductase n=1 Tax=Hyunsoonleella flava TaxID=2527939 RepID=A0A4Q9FFH3_9FLAO|nr:oxidoreductase [Hyunsoonleella flava]TBN04786.1 oxidoreductase [Hyunsoonleella flava]
MKKLLPLFSLIIVCFGFNHIDNLSERRFSSLKIEHLVEDSSLDVRALEIIESKNSIVVYLTSRGELGILMPNSSFNHVDSLKNKPFYNHKIDLSTDTLKLNFRALAINENKGFGITIGSPALVFSLDADLEKNKVVYQENHPKAFYDSMEFWNNQEGIAIGDSTDGCLSVIITRDGGKSWEKLSCDDLPKATENEGAFAASDTNIAIVDNKTWVATTAGRVYFSPDKGNTWEVFATPIVKAEETEGIYSIDFYDELHGFAIGGDYTKPDDNAANKIRTTDGGKTWELVAQNQNPGYRSCVQYVPNGEGRKLVAVGFKGIDYSSDSGSTWQHLSNEGFYTIRFLNDSVAYVAGKGRISKLTFRE